MGRQILTDHQRVIAELWEMHREVVASLRHERRRRKSVERVAYTALGMAEDQRGKCRCGEEGTESNPISVEGSEGEDEGMEPSLVRQEFAQSLYTG